MKCKFELNQKVQVIGAKDRIGIITNIRELENTCVYEVFFSATEIKDFPEKDLVHPGYEPQTIIEKLRAGEVTDEKKFRTLLTLRKIQIPLTTNIYSYLASRTQFYPIQFKPLLKFLNSNYHRILIADEVGVGKTIEAGIIFTEMKARLKDINKVLIICPSYLLQRKWQDEMLSRFDEDFKIIGGEELRICLNDWQNQYKFRGIVSLPLLRMQRYVDLITEVRPDFDLIIIDEAHHFRNTGTNTFHLGELLSSLANVMVFLTATPIHISNRNLFNLLHVLIPQEFANEAVFNLILEPNKSINEAISRIRNGEYDIAGECLADLQKLDLRDRFIGNPIYEETVELLNRSQAIPREERVRLVSNLQELNTLSHVVTRTRKRDFPQSFPVREPYVVAVRLHPSELEFYDAVYTYARRRSRRLSEQGYEIPFLTIMIRRRAASCLPALYKHFRQILALTEYSYDDEEIDDEFIENPSITSAGSEEVSKLSSEDMDDIMDLVEVGRKIGQRDTKFEMFVDSLNELFNQGISKAIVFSFFKDTLNYLQTRLLKTNLNLEVGLIHGDVPFEDREKMIQRFKNCSGNCVLLSSEVGGEGLDLQFCNCIFNYDLPWNPMRVEQRIGRIDRLGQTEKKVLIYNFSVKDTIEEIILYRLYDRINLFREALGDLEEILGEELNNIRRSIFNPELTKTQVEAELEKIADSIVFKQHTHKMFDKERDAILGQDTYFTEQITKVGEERRFITGQELVNLYGQFFNDKFPKTKFGRKAKDSKEYVLRPCDLLKEYLVENIVRGHSPSRKERVLGHKIEDPTGFSLTFSQEYACLNKEIEFASVCHPITKAVLQYYEKPLSNKFVGMIRLRSDDYDPGIYYFVIYLMKTNGYTESVDLSPVVVSASKGVVLEELAKKFLSYEYEDWEGGGQLPEAEQLEGLDRVALEYLNEHCEKTRKDVEEKNSKLIDIRITSLEQTYKVLIKQIDDFIQEQIDHRILRMKESQKANLELKSKKQLKELESKRYVSIETESVAGGLLCVERP